MSICYSSTWIIINSDEIPIIPLYGLCHKVCRCDYTHGSVITIIGCQQVDESVFWQIQYVAMAGGIAYYHCTVLKGSCIYSMWMVYYIAFMIWNEMIITQADD